MAEWTPAAYSKLLTFRNNSTADLPVGHSFEVAGLQVTLVSDGVDKDKLGAGELNREVQFKDFVLDAPLSTDYMFGEAWFDADGREYAVVGVPRKPGILGGVAAPHGSQQIRVIDIESLEMECPRVEIVMNPVMATSLNSITVNGGAPITGPWTFANYDDAGTGIISKLALASFERKSGCTATVALTEDKLVIQGVDFGDNATVEIDYT